MSSKGFPESCHLYDSQPAVCGLGKDNLFARGGIDSIDVQTSAEFGLNNLLRSGPMAVLT